MTRNEMQTIARMVAKELKEVLIAAQDEMWGVEKAAQETPWSKSYLYHNRKKLGGVNIGGRLLFSKIALHTALREMGVRGETKM